MGYLVCKTTSINKAKKDKQSNQTIKSRGSLVLAKNLSRVMVSPTAKLAGLRTQYEQMLHNAVLVTEMATELKERARAGEKYVSSLRSLAVRAARVISTMHNSGKTFILLGQHLALSALGNLEANPTLDANTQHLKQEYERLLIILDKELSNMDDIEHTEIGLSNDINNVTPAGIAERLRLLEAKQKYSELNYLPPTSSARSFRTDVDDKYPGNWSRESLIDLNNVINLPPVPEDIFTCFSKPTRTSSLSSLKSIRKVKLYLQRAANSEDDESEYDDHEFSTSVSHAGFFVMLDLIDTTSRQDDPTSSSEGGDIRSMPSSVKKSGALSNIKEEALQES